MFTTPDAERRTGRAAWVQAMLDFEAALARAQARAGVIPESAANEIAAHCRADEFDVDSISHRAVSSATPVIALVGDLTELLDPAARPYVHLGATSQDVLDTAAMLLTRRTLRGVLGDLHGAADRCARLAEEHRGTLMIGRSLLQQALPTTFGRRCATWLTALTESTTALERVVARRLAVQFGGPAGTLGSLGDQGVAVLEHLAAELGLAEPVLPWHTDRTRIGELAGTLGTVAGALGKIALDVELHAQTEVGELTEGSSGGSSAMPHKQNPAGSVLISAATHRVPGLVATLLAAMPQAHERAAGAWQAEWEPLTELLRLVAAAAAGTERLLAGLRVNTARMSSNVDLTGGLVMAESASATLQAELSRTEAQRLVKELCERVAERGGTLREALLADERVRAALSENEIIEATEPADHLGSAGAFIARALALHESGGNPQ
ncbi:3-carboxy-cis,cis-muconate cycloisomerase [Saccharopolyspora gloriosae]|uniref:3-carboxy-cis,cis-muconate cycloisomerase n=1 Tax=Saccharopolyspora gloriosae TaxID=455344 RepID=UPI001FB75E24|nr:3-carboxy-cis,cis-muconate cycloisomerase [Saccharopolyspora gloriosae]